MLIHPMAERLRGLGLTAMADAFLDMRNQSAADDLSREDWLGHPPADHRRLGPEPLNAEQRRDLLEIVDDREGKGSLLITSQVPIGRWHEIIGDPTLGDAILNRVIHRSHRIT
jgi:hypothetical protein